MSGSRMGTVIQEIFDEDAKAPLAQGQDAGRTPTQSRMGKPVYDRETLIAAAAERYKLDPLWLRALMQVESGGNANAEGPEVGEKNERARAVPAHAGHRERAWRDESF